MVRREGTEEVFGFDELSDELLARGREGFLETAFDDVGGVLGEAELGDLATHAFDEQTAAFGGVAFQCHLKRVVAVWVLGELERVFGHGGDDRSLVRFELRIFAKGDQLLGHT